MNLDALEAENAELRQQMEAITDHMEATQLDGLIPEVGESVYGLGPAASKVYGADGISIGGYGEFLYNNKAGSGDQYDALRAVLYFGYKFNERWVFNSEIEFEHAGTSGGGSAAVEFAYLDYLGSDELNGRVGLVLVPMGFINELHEPTTFLPAQRPLTEQKIIPSTWRENGMGAFGDLGPVTYRTYIVNGLDGSAFDGSGGLRGGRQKGSRAMADDLAWVARVDWDDVPGVLVGGSYYIGDSGQMQDFSGSGGGQLPDIQTQIYELHAEWRARGWQVRGLFAQADVDDVAALEAALPGGGNGATGAVGTKLRGAYVEAGYDILTALSPGNEQALSPYLRYEDIDTQYQTAPGFMADPANHQKITTFGLNWKPIPNIVFKLDYMDFSDQSAGRDGWNFLAGYVF
jgi:hypothetical protein